MLRGRSGARTRLGPDRGSSRGEDDWWADQSSWAKTGAACAVMFLALLVICAGIIGWARLGGSSHPAAAADPLTPGASSSPAETPAPTDSAGTLAPKALTVTWRRVGIGALPFSTTAGPRTVRAGVPSEFSHDSNGAVLAAVQILGRLSWAAESTATMFAVAAADTAPSAQATAALTYAPPSDPTLVPATVAYQAVSETSDQASVDLALRFSGTLRVVPVSLVWAGGDWKLAGAPGPLAQTSWAAIDDLTGFTPFTGQTTTGS